jgi:ferredoxin-thioredoxin reductase catalytic subunit
MITLETVKQRAEIDANRNGYHLTPDPELLNTLLEGLKKNEERYGYPSCPCRMATGYFEIDRDIICPCDYRDPDVVEYGLCYCSLFIDVKKIEGTEIKPIPERRPSEKQLRANESLSKLKKDETNIQPSDVTMMEANRQFWYCKQCGYVTFREKPPYVCPICRAKRELFDRINEEKLSTG